MAAVQPGKIRMVAGLGNPGEEYAQTRHNAGFCSVDALARQAGVSYWKNQLGAEVAVINVADAEAEGGRREVVLVKPQSFMNTSGGPISKLCREYGIAANEVLVIHGLRSIIDKLGSRDFSRIRVGIGEPPGRMQVADFVLKQFRPKEAEAFAETCGRAADAAGLAITRGVIFARDHVNGGAASNGRH